MNDLFCISTKSKIVFFAAQENMMYSWRLATLRAQVSLTFLILTLETHSKDQWKKKNRQYIKKKWTHNFMACLQGRKTLILMVHLPVTNLDINWLRRIWNINSWRVCRTAFLWILKQHLKSSKMLHISLCSFRAGFSLKRKTFCAHTALNSFCQPSTHRASAK